MTGDPIVRLVGVTRRYDSLLEDAEPISGLTDVTFALPRGGFLYLTGPSGAGKSTLVRLLYGGLEASAGEVHVCGMRVDGSARRDRTLLRRRIGVVHQDFRLIENRSAIENVALALLYAGIARAEAFDRAEAMLEENGLTDRLDHPVCELSGGEKQRVGLARALAGRPELIIADEPTGNLDRTRSGEVFSLLDRANAAGAAVIIATHDLRRVEESGRAVLYLTQGRIIATRGDVEARIG